MAGTDILIYDGDASRLSVGFDAAVSSGLVGLWFFNRGLNSRINLASGQADAHIVGAPVDMGTYLRFKGNENFLQTQVEDSAALTQIAVIKSPASMANSANSPMFVSNFGSGAKTPIGATNENLAGASLFCNSNAAILSTSGSRFTDVNNTSVTSSIASVNVTDFTSWFMASSRIDATRQRRNNLTTGVTNLSSFTNQGRVLGAGKFRIGSSFSSSWGGEADVAAVAIYNRFLEDTEINTMRDQIRGVMAFLGITA